MSSGQKVPFEDTKNAEGGGGHGLGDNRRWLSEPYLAGLLFIGLVVTSKLSGESVERLLNRNWRDINCSPKPLGRHMLMWVPNAEIVLCEIKELKSQFGTTIENRVRLFYRRGKPGNKGYQVRLWSQHPFVRGGEALAIYHHVKQHLEAGLRFDDKTVVRIGRRVVREYK